MLAPIQIRTSNSGKNAVQIPTPNSNKTVEENKESFSNIQSKLGLLRQNTSETIRGNVSSYHQEYQYQTYSKEHKHQTEHTCKSKNSINHLSEHLSHLNFRHQISFLNGSAKHKRFTVNQLRRIQWIISNQFHFARKMFENWIAQNIDTFNLRLSNNNITHLVYQQQSLMFKVFLPPKMINYIYNVIA